MTYSETRFVPASDSDTRFVGWMIGGLAATVVAVGSYGLWFAPQSTPPLTSAHVKLTTETGHGSATHIGDGLYVTAAHVVGDSAEVQINGTASPVLWSNAAYDIALVAGPDTAASVPLWCGVADVGAVGIAHGNPMDLSDISTSLTVAGSVRQVGDWKVALPMDGAVGPGMSGGGWVVGGALAGVNVGAALAPAGMFSPSYFGVSIVVPSSVVCALMGRT